MLLSAAGVLAICLVPSASLRDELLASAAGIGVLVLVVLLHITSLAVSVSVGAPIAVAGLVLTALNQRVRARLLSFGRGAIASLFIAALLGLPAVAIGLQPMRQSAQPTVVQPTPNNDAYAFVTEADWLLHHSAVEGPGPHAELGYQYVSRHLSHGLRIGQELVIDTVAVLGRQPVERAYYPLTVLWVALIPGVVVACASLLGLRRRWAYLAGLVLSLGSLEMYQLVNENSAAALGVALAPLALAAVADALDGSGGGRRLPFLAAPFALAGLVGAYAEYTPMLLPAFALFAVARRPARMLAGAGRFLSILAVSIAVSPLAWWHAAKGTLFHLGEPFLGWTSPFLTATPRQFAVRWIGAGDLVNFGADRSSLGVVVFAMALLGIGCAVALAPQRRLWAALLVGSALLVTYLSAINRITYSEQRAVLYSQPLLLLAAAAGVDAAALRLRRAHGQVDVQRVAAVPLAVGVAAFLVLNLIADWRLARPDPATLAHRTVDSSFADVVSWERSFGGGSGTDLLVVSGDYFDQLWLAYTLRNVPQVAYAAMNPDYVDVGPCYLAGRSPLWDGRPRPFVVIDRRSLVSLTGGAHVVAQDGRFLLVSRGSGSVVVAAPLIGATYSEAAGTYELAGPADVLVVALGLPSAARVGVEARNPTPAAEQLSAGQAGMRVEPQPVPPGGTAEAVAMPVGGVARLELVPADPGSVFVLSPGLAIMTPSPAPPPAADVTQPLQAPCA